jgi:hypothetical protein
LAGSGARVCLTVRLTDAVLRDVRINLGRGHVGVPEQRLHAAQIRAAGQQVRGERVAQLMRMDVPTDSRAAGGAPDDFPERLTRELAPARRREE